jgi:endonuclease/exonuclease/phosphatase family metal-dependent hydrolase
LLLRDIRKGTDDVLAVANVIAHIAPDIIALQDIDYDADNLALNALANLLRDKGQDYPHVLSLRPNTGRITGLDMDGDGKLGEAQDAQGYGRFSGDGGMGLLSKFPILASNVLDFSDLLWTDFPNA